MRLWQFVARLFATDPWNETTAEAKRKSDTERLTRAMGPRYRYTQTGNPWKLRIRNPRLYQRRRSA